jgi:hypothetical protein
MLLAALIVCLAASLVPSLADVPLHGFEDLSVWSGYKDGGNPPIFTSDTQTVREGKALRLKYTDRTPQWGNLNAPCTVPPEAVALRFWIYKHSAAPGAALHIWLFEPDGDGWVQRVPFSPGGELSATPSGWQQVRMPISAFRFDPRGKNTRQLTGVNRMLIGCNFADLEVTVDSMTWETGQTAEPMPLPTTPDLRIETGPKGALGILDLESGLPASFRPAHKPAELAAVLRAAGFGVTILKPGNFADPAVLTPAKLDTIILPCGPYFPQAAQATFLAYVKAGGSFLSTDGYAFDQLLQLTNKGWSASGVEKTAANMDKPDEAVPIGLNNRLGKTGDSMNFSPDQIPVFDPQFQLEHATRLRLSEGYGQPDPAAGGSTEKAAGAQRLTYSSLAPFQGFSACVLTGLNSAVFPQVYRRWVSVLDAVTEEGQVRGSGLALALNYTGPFRGSVWAFSGLTDGTDLFLGDASRRDLLVRVVSDLADKVFLHELTTDLACYEPGETPQVSVKLSNFGKRPAERRLCISVSDGTVLEKDLTIQPGETRTFSVSASAADLARDGDLVPVRAWLAAEGRLADRLETAYCVRSPQVLASGPRLRWQGNYMTVDGRATFLIGSNQTGMMYYSPDENPRTWDRDFRSMSDNGYHILRILHFSPFAKGSYESGYRADPLDLLVRPERLVRQMDAIVQLAQKHRVALFLSLHDWQPLALTEEELRAQADWDRFWAARYRDVPGIFFDVQNEPTVDVPDRPDIRALWNSFLKDRYGSDEALRAAWKKHPPEAAMPGVPLSAMTDQWDDCRSADRKRFEAEILNRWVKANVDGLKSGSPEAPVTVGFLQSMPNADKLLGTRYTDFSNMHFYGSIQSLAPQLKLIDRRFEGKGFSLGEFGARDAHTARNQGSTRVPVTECTDYFRSVAHYVTGMGGAFAAVWSWKDFDEMVFPWGLVHRESYVTKPWLHALQQSYLLASFAQPVYEAPELYLLVPDQNRIGPRFNEIHQALFRAIDLLLDQRVNFGVLNEEDLDKLPPQARAILWPLPYCPTDAAFAGVRDWVKAGGSLYLSGDVSFDPQRQPTRSSRRAELGLAKTPVASPFDVPAEAWGQAPVETQVGQGKVLYVPYPLELRAHDTDAGVYQRFLRMAGIGPVELVCDEAQGPFRALSIPTAGGGRLTMIARNSSKRDLAQVTLPAAGVTLELGAGGCAFILQGAQGQVIGAETDGRLVLGDQKEEFAFATGPFGVCALDGKDLRQSQQVMVLPGECETVRVPSLAGLKGGQLRLGVPAQLQPATVFSGSALSFEPAGTGRIAVVAPATQMQAATDKVLAHLHLQTANW